MNRKYVPQLTAQERAWMEAMVRTGKSGARKIRLAHALLKMDQGKTGQAGRMRALPGRSA